MKQVLVGFQKLEQSTLRSTKPFVMSGLSGGLGRTRICDLYRVKVEQANHLQPHPLIPKSLSFLNQVALGSRRPHWGLLGFE